MHLAQHITEELNNPINNFNIKEIAKELEKSLTIEALQKLF
tara:strand:+ start:7700 stop:7822 length:123 start_codon:yes stop_codon:yes gene_type:complete